MNEATKIVPILGADVERRGFDIQLTKDRVYHGRMYEHNGVRGLSVSTAMACFVPLFLQDWTKRNTEKAIEKRKEETSGTGTEGHALIESEAKGEEVAPKEELKEWYSQWQRVRGEYDITAEYSEVKVFSDVFCYGGQIDRVGMFKGRRAVIDFKTGHYSHVDLWKTEAYRQAYVEMTGDVDVDTVVLYLPRPDLIARGHKPREYKVERHIPCFLSFLSAYYNVRMYYYKELIAAGMDKKRMFDPLPFLLYERENGIGFQKEMK